MNPEITIALELYEEADNLTKYWLVKSFSLTDEDKEIAKLQYRKACRSRLKLAKRLSVLVDDWEKGNSLGFESVGSILDRKQYDFLRGGAKE